MSLPWFPFHIDKFLSDTLALDGEAGGGYLFLILHYYATEKPPRDNDRTLATIARLPMDRWLERRPDIESFFDVRDGHWHHTTIESEMAEAKLKLSHSRAAAVAGGHARWAKTREKAAAPQPKRHQTTVSDQNHAPAQPAALPEAMPKQCPADAPSNSPNEHSLHLHLKKDSLSTDRDAIAGQEAEPESVGTPIDPKFWPDPNHVTVCKIDGATDEIIQAEVAAFIAYKQDKGQFSHDWDGAWTSWWIRWRAHRDKLAKASKPKAPPRVEVSSAPLNWAGFCDDWVKYQRWPNRGAGGEPGTVACRCPTEVMVAAGIDPATGLKPAPKWQPSPAKEPV